jgi:hypothetical protein
MKIAAALLASGMLLTATPALTQQDHHRAQTTAVAVHASGISARETAREGVDDPVAWVRAAYSAADDEGHGLSADSYSKEPVFSPRLRALFADDERYAGGEIGRLDFNPFTGAQDDDIKQVAVEAHEVDGAAERKVVVARFQNMDTRQSITYYFERIGGRWYIDDIMGRATGKDEAGWALSLILKYGYSGD